MKGRVLVSGAVLILIVSLAIAFRFSFLEMIPPGLYPDEAMNGVDALTALETGDYDVYYPANNGREGLFINLQAGALALFGNEIWALRIVSGIFGVLAVLGLFFVARLLRGNRVAFVASYLMAVSFWAVNFSRIGFRAIMLPAILVWSFYFLWRGMVTRSSWSVFAGGLIFGIGMHSYISFRIAPLILLILFVFLLVRRIYPARMLVRWGVLFFVGFLLVASPLLLYYAQNPADFMGRASQVSIFESDSPPAALGESIVKTLGMFTFAGDFNWRHNIAGRPLLLWPVAVGFVVGIVLLFVRSRKGIPAGANVFLGSWFAVMLIPNFFAPEGAPHALRALGAQPAVFLLASIGLVSLYDWVQRRLSAVLSKARAGGYAAQVQRVKREIAVLAILVLAFVGVWEAKAYFARWAFNAHTRGAFTERLVLTGEFLNRTSAENKFFIVNEHGGLVDGIPVPAMTVLFVVWEDRGEVTFLNPEDVVSLPSGISNAVFVFALPDEALSDALIARYGGGPIGSPLATGVRIP